MKIFHFFSPNLRDFLFLMGFFLLHNQATQAQVPCEGPYFLIVNDYATGTHVYSYDDPNISYPNSCLTGSGAGGGDGIAINYGSSSVYIAKIDGTVELWDAINGTLAATFNVGESYNVFDIALSNDGLYLYVATQGGLYVYSATSGALIDLLSSPDINNQPLWGVDINPITGNVYVTDGRGAGATTTSITIISPQPTLAVINTIVTEPLPSSGYGEFVGLEFADDGSFWVVKQKDTGTTSDFVLHYDANGNLIKTCDLNNAGAVGAPTDGNGNAWDLVIGADGNLLVTAYGSQTQVYAVDSATCASTPFLTNAGYSSAKGIALGCVEMICEPCVVDITNSGNTSICAGSTTGVTFNVLNAFDTHTITITPTAPYSTTDTDRSDGITYTLDAQPNITTDYTIQVNSNGCMESTNVTVTVNDLAVSCAKTDVTTNGGTDGTASTSATGGTAPHTYLWSNGETSANITGLTAGDYTVTVTDLSGCTANCMVTITQPNAPLPDLSLAKTVNTSITTLNGTVIFTLTLTNDNGIDATDVVVTDNLPAGLTFVSSSDPANVNVSGNILTWNVGNMLGTDAPKTLQITVTAAAEGSFVNTAEITAMNETDTDSTPNNNTPGEDDQDQACFSVPVKLCSDNAGATITVTSIAATSWQWYVSTDNISYAALSGENSQDLVINNTLMGGNGITKYFKVAYNGAAITDNCGATMCCPIIVTTETCIVCPPPKCIPITITKTIP